MPCPSLPPINCVLHSSNYTLSFSASLPGRTHSFRSLPPPQIHGHDFSCLAVIPGGTPDASYAYVCGSEEKVLRVMEATQAFLDTLDMARGLAPGGFSDLIMTANRVTKPCNGPMHWHATGMCECILAWSLLSFSASAQGAACFRACAKLFQRNLVCDISCCADSLRRFYGK